MPDCPKCGSKGDGRYCPSCGTALTQPSAATPLPGYIIAALCYVLGPISGLLFLTLEPYSREREVRFHAWQSILFGCAALAVFLAGPMLSFLVPWTMLAVISFAEIALLMCGLVVWVVLMYKAYVGERWLLPVLGPIAERKA